MNTKEQEALTLALEGAANYIDVLGGDSRKYRQVLAQQNPQGVSNEQVEPVAWMHPSGGILGRLVTGLERENYTIPLYTHPPVPTAQPDLIKNERDKLRAFAQEIMEGWPYVGMLDGFDLQELAVKHGLLAETTCHKPCAEEGCSCAEMVDEQDWKEGVQCYHSTDLLKGVA